MDLASWAETIFRGACCSLADSFTDFGGMLSTKTDTQLALVADHSVGVVVCTETDGKDGSVFNFEMESINNNSISAQTAAYCL